jgi:hypothetical protein
MKDWKYLYTKFIEYHATILFNKNEPSHAYFNEQLTFKELQSEFEGTEIAKNIINTYKQWVELEK